MQVPADADMAGRVMTLFKSMKEEGVVKIDRFRTWTLPNMSSHSTCQMKEGWEILVPGTDRYLFKIACWNHPDNTRWQKTFLMTHKVDTHLDIANVTIVPQS